MRSKLMQYQAFADAIGIPPAPIDFGLRCSAEEETRVQQLIADVPRPTLAVILGSSWPSRLYFPAAIAEVIRQLARPVEGSVALFPVLIGGEDDRDLAAEVMRELRGAAAVNLAGRTSLRDLITIFTECSAAFGPDSGPMHIAAAVGCPVISLWGATAPERSAPWGFADFTIHGDIPCHPCYLRQCPIDRECMRRITPATVVAAVRKALAMHRQSDESRKNKVVADTRRAAKV
jgi:ADP-heptose:LPS heptosyltransferase